MRHSFIAATAIALLSAGPASTAPIGPARTITGAPFSTTGEVTIIHFWATWCAPCRAEMPILDAFYRKYHSRGLAMLAISIDEGVSRSKLQQVTGKFAFPVARIDEVTMPRRDIPAALPLTRIYDGHGKLVFESKGDGRTVIDAATLDRVVPPLLGSR